MGVRNVDDARVRRYMERYGFDRRRAEELAAAMSRPTTGRDRPSQAGQEQADRRPLRSGT
jgi:hypothetical protein